MDDQRTAHEPENREGGPWKCPDLATSGPVLGGSIMVGASREARRKSSGQGEKLTRSGPLVAAVVDARYDGIDLSAESPTNQSHTTSRSQ